MSFRMSLAGSKRGHSPGSIGSRSFGGLRVQFFECRVARAQAPARAAGQDGPSPRSSTERPDIRRRPLPICRWRKTAPPAPGTARSGSFVQRISKRHANPAAGVRQRHHVGILSPDQHRHHGPGRAIAVGIRRAHGQNLDILQHSAQLGASVSFRHRLQIHARSGPQQIQHAFRLDKHASRRRAFQLAPARPLPRLPKRAASRAPEAAVRWLSSRSEA